AKYGALSVATGRVHIDVRQEGSDIRVDWREEGGPAVTPASGEGFGSRLMQLSVERQLGGRLTRDWRPEGLAISLWIPAQSMSRAAEERA
ncbi:MAG TPA: histidine kinase, partial [Sphingobium sp.]